MALPTTWSSSSPRRSRARLPLGPRRSSPLCGRSRRTCSSSTWSRRSASAGTASPRRYPGGPRMVSAIVRWNRMEKAQQVRKDKGDGHGYRCGRCGQPKRGHICPALTSGERLEGENLVKRATALSAMASRKISVQQAAQALDKERKAKGSSSRGLKGKLAKMGSSRILNVAELFDLVAGSSDP
ncbi:hypothetical protein EMIHUDRAFT_420405 [Emiliania huxleyi CCMP1516]|uniref:Uncharacterized protein n=2 Tax=Emiliania huxleyi TaxID=2903 RepID=A0A0D3J426_EMIH1|nr:hypothetical protein EMIHUDRAFT_420405 [Emiliania huxleyi CCMP1516]EOD18261.1 hypothetical protein EMIHUDRAFT_420405 [Emiliania huxleyi CCMP1516]|eukprot:XP_005770690.1 hypothetical protein EMIHUDRAFT_420405 [Emiliania huxleyi CCMP1516]